MRAVRAAFSVASLELSASFVNSASPARYVGETFRWFAIHNPSSCPASPEILIVCAYQAAFVTGWLRLGALSCLANTIDRLDITVEGLKGQFQVPEIA